VAGALLGAGVVAAAALGRLRLATLPRLAVVLSNTYGLVCIIALLGYGLVDVPRSLWRASFPEARLRWRLHRVGGAAARAEAAAAELERALAVVLITAAQVPRSDPGVRAAADALVAYAARASPVPPAALADKRIDVESLEERDLDYASDADGLARLRERVQAAIAAARGCAGEYAAEVRAALALEAACKARALGVYTQPPPGSDGRSGGRAARAAAAAAWGARVRFGPAALKLAAAAAALGSAAIVWAEATIGSGRRPDLSPFSRLAHAEALAAAPWALQAAVAVPLAYAAACCYSSLFKLRLLSFYHLAPRATSARSLLLNGSLLARFAAPLAFNYLHVVRMTGGQRGGRRLAFAGVLGLEEVPLLGSSFNTWFPLFMVAYVLILATGWCEAAAARLVPARLRFDGDRADDEHSARGAALLAAEAAAAAAGDEPGEALALFGPRRGDGAGASTGGAAPPLPGSARQPLFAPGAPRSDAPAPPPPVRASRAAPASPDAADLLFAGVGSSSGRGGRGTPY
jgi:hypothetical protein